MRGILFCLLLLVGLVAKANTNTVDFRPSHCLKDQSRDPQIKMEDMGWEQNPELMASKFAQIYASGKRLEVRAYHTEAGFVLPTEKGEEVKLTSRFINSVKTHIETALARGFVNHIFFSDMGHSHLFVDAKMYHDVIAKIPNSDKKQKYEIMLNHEKTKFLYHTAEQLEMKINDKLIDDRQIQWRFFSRNILGNNLALPQLELIYAKDHKMNSAHIGDYDKGEKNYRYWGAGFSISASKDGCFAYVHNGETEYFDISLYDVKYNKVTNGYLNKRSQ